MDLPTHDRPYWQPGEGSSEHELLYPGWGERQFGEMPCPVVRHQGWIYFVVEDGSPTFVTEAARRRITKGTALIVGPDHASGWDDTESRACRLLTWIWRSPATPLLSAAPADTLRIVPLPTAIIARVQLLHALCREEVRMADHVMAAALGGLHRLVEATLIRPDEVRTDHEQSAERVSLAIRWMESHLESRQPAVRIADYLGVSASTLHRLFKQETGHSPDAHFHELKMTEARKRLGEGRSVKRVGYELGYRHPGDFSRAYTRHFGHPPALQRQ
jgi:AraC-like DNA-binding protein